MPKTIASILVLYPVFSHRTCFLYRSSQHLSDLGYASFSEYTVRWRSTPETTTITRKDIIVTWRIVFSGFPLLHFTLLSFLHERRHYGQHKSIGMNMIVEYLCPTIRPQGEEFLIRGAGMHCGAMDGSKSRIGRHDFLYKGQAGIPDEINGLLYHVCLPSDFRHLPHPLRSRSPSPSLLHKGLFTYSVPIPPLEPLVLQFFSARSRPCYVPPS